MFETCIPLALNFACGVALRYFHRMRLAWLAAIAVAGGNIWHLVSNGEMQVSLAITAVAISTIVGTLGPEMFRGTADGIQGFLTRNFGWILGGIGLVGACLVLPEEQLKGVLTLLFAGTIGWHVFRPTPRKKKKSND